MSRLWTSWPATGGHLRQRAVDRPRRSPVLTTIFACEWLNWWPARRRRPEAGGRCLAAFNGRRRLGADNGALAGRQRPERGRIAEGKDARNSPYSACCCCSLPPLGSCGAAFLYRVVPENATANLAPAAAIPHRLLPAETQPAKRGSQFVRPATYQTPDRPAQPVQAVYSSASESPEPASSPVDASSPNDAELEAGAGGGGTCGNALRARIRLGQKSRFSPPRPALRPNKSATSQCRRRRARSSR